MERKTISYTYTKENNKWVLSCHEIDPSVVAFNLMHALISKKLHNVNYISRITENALYNGYRKITVYYTNNSKTDYYIPDYISTYLLDMSKYDSYIDEN